ncbi:MAG TPA: NUDIX domain-containing protein [archaeon]|nr:NUDIX domain-containing protein [archaeon]
MPTEQSAGAVIFRYEDGKILYLLLRRGPTYWDLPKGNIDKGEDEQTTAEREIKEETGIEDAKILPNFKEKISYFYKLKGQTIYKEVVFFLAETKSSDVKISKEHDDFGWFEYEEALAKVKSKEIIQKANEFLKSSKSKNLKEFL